MTADAVASAVFREIYKSITTIGVAADLLPPRYNMIVRTKEFLELALIVEL